MTEAITNSIEGPKIKAVVHISQDGYKKMWSESDDPYRQVINAVINQLPENELKTALTIGNEERGARVKIPNQYFHPVITLEAEKYAFRGIKRRSDDLPISQSVESTLTLLEPYLFKYGIDAPKNTSAAGNIMSGMPWDTFTFPNPSSVDAGIDMSFILVYRNEPYILPTENDKTLTQLFIPRSKDARESTKTISVEEAKQKTYPTLRDLFIGYIEIHYEKNK